MHVAHCSPRSCKHGGAQDKCAQVHRDRTYLHVVLTTPIQESHITSEWQIQKNSAEQENVDDAGR